MTKTQKKSFNKLIYIILILIFIIVVIFLLKPPKTASLQEKQIIPPPSPADNISRPRLYRSKLLKIEVLIPSGYTFEDKFAQITLEKNKQQILIGRSGTNFTNLDGALQDLIVKNRMIIKKEALNINGLEAISSLDNHGKVYFIFADGWFFNLETNYPSIYSDLDQIAQSFKYIP